MSPTCLHSVCLWRPQVWLQISNPSDEPSASDLTADEYAALNQLIIETYQLGNLDDVIGVDILSFGIVEPLPDTDSESWQVYANLEVRARDGFVSCTIRSLLSSNAVTPISL